MNNVTQHTGLDLPAETPNGSARATAIASAALLEPEPTSIINYVSRGSLYILGTDERARQVAAELAKNPTLSCTLVTIDKDEEAPCITLEAMPVGTQAQPANFTAKIQGSITAVKGYLGQFDLILHTPHEKTTLRDVVGASQGRIDIILDLTRLHLVKSEVKPPGYYKVVDHSVELEMVLREIQGLVGEFEKPKYFNFNPDICAHSRSHIIACRRCIDSCPTGAISSIDDMISVNANLCQGAGSCATACPTGAITYAYPQLRDNLQYLHVVLSAYYQAGGEQAIILFYDASTGRDLLEQNTGELPDNVIPVELEELGSVGMDSWFSCLAYGAKGVALLATPQVPALVLMEMKQQLSYSSAILEGMGFPDNAIHLVNNNGKNDFISSLTIPSAMPEVPVADFFDSNEKRKVIHAALDHLYQTSERSGTNPRVMMSLPMEAPFGEVWLDETRCTLCMSCVWQCPGKALIAGGNQPQLKFVENDCVQCGLCARTCPEDAIEPSPRYLYDKLQRQTPRVLYQEQPFLCIMCGKAFASRSIIEKMTAKLQQHAMFQGDALRRIQMCEDCRVRDIYRAEKQLHKEKA